MRQVLIRHGNAEVTQVPAPQVGDKEILVRVSKSCISVGTEMAGVKASAMPLYKRALKQPDNVKRVFDMARDQGARRTIDRVLGKLASGNATGYSAAGVVIAIGKEVSGFAINERVACAGAGVANHAEVICVPVNLAVKIPTAVSMDEAATVTLGAIAMQGVRRCTPTLGETVLLLGLGVIGQLSAQILLANGCRVIGVDLDKTRIEAALSKGMNFGICPSEEDIVDRVYNFTEGLGADAAIVTAASSSHKIISEAMQSCRKKGRVVLVGDVGLNLKRSDFYTKELDFFISSSYGPGRYDPYYEEGGQDYPIGYVRWTENRNMKAYLELIRVKKIDLKGFYDKPFPVTNANDAYESLKGEGTKPLFVLLTYEENEKVFSSLVVLRENSIKSEKIGLSIIGASSFAQGMHLPNLFKLRSDFSLRGVVSRTGANARAVADQYQAGFCSTNFDDVIADEETDLIMVTTRHDLHGKMTLAGLNAGKSVFVEKPLTLDLEDLNHIYSFFEKTKEMPVLMVGYNRRFSPVIIRIKQAIENRTSPMIVNYRMNAGYIPLDHWVHGPEGGGRNMGEACHIYDLFNFLVGSTSIQSVKAHAVSPQSDKWSVTDNFVVSIKYTEGSICNLTYTALGNKQYSKEQMEVYFDGYVAVMDDYKSCHFVGGNFKKVASKVADKGQFQELNSLADCLLRGQSWPISLDEIICASRVSFEVDAQIKEAV